MEKINSINPATLETVGQTAKLSPGGEGQG